MTAVRLPCRVSNLIMITAGQPIHYFLPWLRTYSLQPAGCTTTLCRGEEVSIEQGPSIGWTGWLGYSELQDSAGISDTLLELSCSRRHHW